MNLEKSLETVADYLQEKYNPCQMDGDKCLVYEHNQCCAATRFGDPCPHMRENKCHNPNLECKLWFCKQCQDKMTPECKESFYELERIAIINQLIERPFLEDMCDVQ